MRTCGILLPISSLPSPYGIGCFSGEAYEFVDQLARAGQTYWQILPLGPTGYGDSPYQSFSAFAGNPYFIDLDALAAEGLLQPEEYQSLDFGQDPADVDYAKLYQRRYPLLRTVFSRADLQNDDEYQRFCEEEADWLEDYSLYMAIKDHHGSTSWDQWEPELRQRDEAALSSCRKAYADEMQFYCFLQYKFRQQWARLKAYAGSKGIQIIGDIPIYVAFDSADSWAHPELFQFDENRRPVKVAGCPPDAFAADGQLWGNPLYDWEYHEKTGYAWWIRRMEHCFRLYDVVRVDHFRGFDEYYAIPYGDPTAANGLWQKGPGMKLFHALKNHLGSAKIIAEDLGYVTDSVKALVQGTGYPGMKLIEFAFDAREAGDYMPYTYEHNSIVYTGTHDNQPLAAWYGELTDEERALARDYLNLSGDRTEEIVWAFIRLTLQTVADTAIIPMQDYLSLGREARMNQPSTLGTNWRWRMERDAFSQELISRIAYLAKLYGRLPQV
jgi:4-alpha-glucanotransferase